MSGLALAIPMKQGTWARKSASGNEWARVDVHHPDDRAVPGPWGWSVCEGVGVCCYSCDWSSEGDEHRWC